MNSNEGQSNPEVAVQTRSQSTHQHRKQRYHKVSDERKRPIRGLWVRNGRYYAQLTVEDPHTGQKQVRRVPLNKATTPAQAKAEMEELLVQRRKGKLPVLKSTPNFGKYADQYLEFHRQAKDKKRASSMETEGYAITRWKANLEICAWIRSGGFTWKATSANGSGRAPRPEPSIWRSASLEVC